jgi:hypothetical protein
MASHKFKSKKFGNSDGDCEARARAQIDQTQKTRELIRLRARLRREKGMGLLTPQLPRRNTDFSVLITESVVTIAGKQQRPVEVHIIGGAGENARGRDP